VEVVLARLDVSGTSRMHTNRFLIDNRWGQIYYEDAGRICTVVEFWCATLCVAPPLPACAIDLSIPVRGDQVGLCLVGHCSQALCRYAGLTIMRALTSMYDSIREGGRESNCALGSAIYPVIVLCEWCTYLR
jgi:hypothetical protein